MGATQDAFSATYTGARAKFLAAATAAGARIESHRHPLRGPTGEMLFCDVAILGADGTQNWLLVVSGVHGVEGYCGSGAQIGWLQAGCAEQLPAGTGALFVHALNPWGFAHDTRTTEDGSDLCRNFVNFAAPLPEHPEYDDIVADLVPQDWFGPGKAAADARLSDLVDKMGSREVVGIIARGQYRHLFGPFYGGSRPAWSNLLFARILREKCANAQRLACVDYHTGLGPPGIGQLLLFHPPGSASEDAAKSVWGQRAAQTATGESIAYRLTGSILGFLEAALPGTQVIAGAYEFGTLPPEEVFFHALRADRWLAAYGDPATAQAAVLRRRVRDAFYVETPEWKTAVVEQASWAHARALDYIAQGGP